MQQMTLVIMAAGLGSRYGGLKQMDAMDEQGHPILYFSAIDAKRAGFTKVVFVIRKEMQKALIEKIGRELEQELEVVYVYQEFIQGREKPLGTAHALLCCKEVITEPFAVMNADDYYGPGTFVTLRTALEQLQQEPLQPAYVMIGYSLGKTLTQNGTVSRGVCELDAQGYLKKIVEKTRIAKRGDEIYQLGADGTPLEQLSKERIVSMNCWGFTPDIFVELERGFQRFLQAIKEDAIAFSKQEYFLPDFIQELIETEKAFVRVLHSTEQWYGVTYQQDKEQILKIIQERKDRRF